MADTKIIDIKLLKRTQISVHVEEALPDLLVVSYELGVKIYKGVLLESTKRNLPCGIPSLHPAFTKTDAEDPLYAVNQRFAYVEPKAVPHALAKKNAYIPGKHKHSKMTVRLRPRQVLCSKCKGICNENSENVGRKRKASIDITDSGNHSSVSAKRSANAPVTRASMAENKVRFELRSRQTLLSPPQRESANVVTKASAVEDNSKVLSAAKDNDYNKPAIVADVPIVPKKSDLRSARRTLRRKPAEDNLQVSTDNNDEGKNNNIRTHSNANSASVVSEISSGNSNSSSSTCSSTRTIKICYGPQGEGTVLKIPALIENLLGNTTDEKEIDVLNEVPMEVDPIGHASDRATRKALKKAKKEARKRPSTPLLTNNTASSGSTISTSITVKASCAGAALSQSMSSHQVAPNYHHQQLPHATAGAVSPARYTHGADAAGSASPKHGVGCASTPRAVVEGASAGDKLDVNEQSGAVTGSARRRKHKVKHKKRHREDRERKTLENEDDTNQCSTQKLSINLKRLNDTYCATTIPFLPIDESSASSDELIPDFPPNETQESNSNLPLNSVTKDADGSIVCAGDVVWGKMQGFPWWPAKVLSITDGTVTDKNGDASATVHVSWYGSDTSSLLLSHHLSNYLRNFKMRYNKKKRGPYKEAIRLATIEARFNAERQPIVTPFLPTADNSPSDATTAPAPIFSYQSTYSMGGDSSGNTATAQEQSVAVSPTHSNTSPILTSVRPALASPREINVIS